MQQIGFDRVLCCCWRCKLATRLEMNRLKPQFDNGDTARSPDSAPSCAPLPERWYGAGRAELQAAMRFFASLRHEVAANGFSHLEEWKDQIVGTCGHQQFYDSLMQLKPPLTFDEMLFKAAMTAKIQTYALTDPQGLLTAERQRELVESQLKHEMCLRLIDDRIQHLENLARMNLPRGTGTGEGSNGGTVDLITRYFTAATRELERSVMWYQDLKTQGL
jgi:hypothetical protein